PAFALVSLLLVAMSRAIPATGVPVKEMRPPRWDLPVRMAVATGMVIGLTAVAAALGPTLTGLLSPFPVFALVLGGFTHRFGGAAAAAHLLRGVVLGSLAHATMFALIAALLPRSGLGLTYSVAALGALAVNALALAAATRGSGARAGSG